MLAACKRPPSQNARPEQSQRIMINGNMIIPFDTDGALDASMREELQSTGLSAIKLSIGGASGSYKETLDLLDEIDRDIEINSEIYLPINRVSDISRAYEAQKVGIIKSFEAATMFDAQVGRIREFADRGVRIMQLGYNKTSPFGAGVMTDTEPFGLSELGQEAIATMEASGVLLDLSHAHPQTTFDAIEASKQPVSLTHTGCLALNDNPRLKSDKLLRAVAENGGVIGIFELSYLTASMDQTPLVAFMAHLQHAIDVCGTDHVAIGSDAYILSFDTSPENRAKWDAVNAERKKAGIAAPGEGPMPFVEGLNGAHRMNTIVDELRKLGHSEDTVDKIMGQNFMRVFKDTWPG